MSRDPHPPNTLRQANEERVLRALRSGATLSQADLARATGLSTSTVSNLVHRLSAEGLVTTAPLDRRARGVRLAQRADTAVGVDLGHRHLTVVCGTREGTVTAAQRIAVGPGLTAPRAIELITPLVDRVLTDAAIPRGQIAGVGVGVPTPLDRDNRQVAAPSILPGWVGYNLGALLSEALGLEAVVDNDANLGALAEAEWGAGRDSEAMAYLKLSEGVGAGLVIGGELYRGRHGIAGEVGHTTIDDLGRVCRCGNRGCLETMVAARAVSDLIEPVHGPGLSIQDIVDHAAAGDAPCGRVLSDTGRLVGVAVANLVNVLNPDLIVIGGELAVAGDFIIAPMREVVRRQGIPVATAGLRITTAELGPRAQAMGAVLLALHELAPIVVTNRPSRGDNRPSLG